MDKVIRPSVPKKEDLIAVYDVLNRVFKNNAKCFYTKSQSAELKKDKTKISL